MLTDVSIKSSTPPSVLGGHRLVCSPDISVSAPPFEGAEFREARIFSRPGEILMMELLFVCEKLPPNAEMFLLHGLACRYNDQTTGVIVRDCQSLEWNATYHAKVGWHWVRVLCFVASPFSISAASGGHFDIRGGRDKWGAFSDYDQHESDLRMKTSLDTVPGTGEEAKIP